MNRTSKRCIPKLSKNIFFTKLLPLSLIFTSSYSFAIDAPNNLQCNQTGNSEIQWSWDTVPDAALYDVIVNNQFVGQVTDARFNSANLAAGARLIVKAISANWDYSGNSQEYSCQPGTGPGTGPGTDDPRPTQDDTGLIDPQSLAQPEVYNKPGYQLVFSDEFNGDSLNPNRWNSQLRWDGSFNGERYEYRTINGEAQFYVNILSQDQNHLDTIVPNNNPFEFNGSRVAIRAKRNPLQTYEGNNSYGPLQDMVAQREFMSGALTTYDKFSQKYGFFEARIKIPSQVGTFPAFWLHHQRRESEGTQRSEIDIMENLGHSPWYIYNSFHYFTGVAEGVTGNHQFVRPQPGGQIYSGTDYSQDYHVYAVEWEPGHIRYLIDGQTVSELWNENVNHEELYVIMNLAIGGNWTNYPANIGGLGRAEGNHFPNRNDIETWSNPALEIDYVRVFERN